MRYYHHKRINTVYEHVIATDNEFVVGNRSNADELYIISDNIVKRIDNPKVTFKNKHKEITKEEYDNWIFVNSLWGMRYKWYYIEKFIL